MSHDILEKANFDWVTQLDDVWEKVGRSDGFVHREKLAVLERELDRMQPYSASPFGKVVVGSAGAGKTHFLRHLRAASHERGGFFFLVDCTDIRDFWATVSLGVVRGLLQEQANHPDWSQAAFLRYHLTVHLYPTPEAAAHDIFAEKPVSDLADRVRAALEGLPVELTGRGISLLAVLKAVFLLTSHEPFVRESASMWMQGAALDESTREQLQLPSASADPLELLRALTLLLSHCGPTVIAFDQLDALISQHHHHQKEAGREESDVSQRASAILQSTGAGLMGLFDGTVRTLTVLSCLHENWDILREKMGNAAQARFHLDPIVLTTTPDPSRVRKILRSRIEFACGGDLEQEQAAVNWFGDAFFDRFAAATPREILRAAEEKRNQSADPSPPSDLQEKFDERRLRANVAPAMAEEKEDDLGKGLLMVLRLLCHELDLPEDVDFQVDTNFAGGRNYPTLHARLRLVFRAEGDREFHVCVRVLQKNHHSAFRARLDSAMVEAGIDRGLPFRKLLLFRSTDQTPRGARTQELVETFRNRGGEFHRFEEADVAVVRALLELAKESGDGFEHWLSERKPLSRCPSWKPIADLLRGELSNSTPNDQPDPEKAAARGDETETAPRRTLPPGKKNSLSSSTPTDPRLTLGYRTGSADGNGSGPVDVPISSLSRHIIIRAGSGGGKTVLIKRLVEEAALLGVSSVVLDPGNDLAHLGNDWDKPPPGWREQDSALRDRLRQSSEVIIHTPGRSDGRPLFLPFLPDLSALADHPDDLQAALTNAVERLGSHIAAGNSATAHNKRGILAQSLRKLSHRGEPLSVARLADYLAELPPEADPGIHQAQKLGSDMSGALRSLLAQNPDLDRSDHLADWTVLFGAGEERARISVINFTGIPELGDQQDFVNRLAESLFAWSKNNPSCGRAGITGLFVIDEAKDFLPSQRSTPCKLSLMRLAAQARKYGIGLVFATQNPKDLDYNAVAQFSTQYFGRANMPQVIDFIRDLLSGKGAPNANPSQLNRGEFYLAADGGAAPVRVESPMCLTFHPDGRPLTQSEVIELARR